MDTIRLQGAFPLGAPLSLRGIRALACLPYRQNRGASFFCARTIKGDIKKSRETEKMEKTRYCKKCQKLFKVNDLAPDSFRCPYCGHVITPFEASTFETFGIFGTKKGCCGCLIVIVIAFVILMLCAAVQGENSNGSTPENRTQTSESR